MRNTTDPVVRRRFLAIGGAGVAAAIIPKAAAAADLTAAEQANVDVVNAFCDAWSSGDANKITSYLADDCIVRFNVSDPKSKPVQGREAVAGQIAKFLGGSKITFIVNDTWAHGVVVANNRVDRLVSPQRTSDFHLTGVFYLRDGKIVEWSDYVHRQA